MLAMRQQTTGDGRAVNESASRHGWTEIATRDPHLRSFVRSAALDGLGRGAMRASPAQGQSLARAPLLYSFVSYCRFTRCWPRGQAPRL